MRDDDESGILKRGTEIQSNPGRYARENINPFPGIEAKNEDLTRGFTQLSVELIAVDRWLDNEDDQIYGTVSTGSVWQFAILDRAEKRITQDLNLYTLPNDLHELLAILLGILIYK